MTKSIKIRHILDGRTYCDGTERYIVYGLCGYEEEASGSGRHTVDVGDVECPACKLASARRDEHEKCFEWG